MGTAVNFLYDHTHEVWDWLLGTTLALASWRAWLAVWRQRPPVTTDPRTGQVCSARSLVESRAYRNEMRHG